MFAEYLAVKSCCASTPLLDVLILYRLLTSTVKLFINIVPAILALIR